jgi:hypothetical protein
MTPRRGVVAVALLALVLSGCGDDGGSTGGREGTADRLSGSTTAGDEAGEGDDGHPACDVDGAVNDAGVAPVASVDVTVSEFAFSLSRDTAPAGPVELVARNIGLIAHEVTVVRHDGDPGSFPLNPVGGADTSGLPDGAEVGRIWSFDPDVTCRATFDLAPGRYALLCNVVDDGTNPHYSQGMHTALEVVAG